MILLRSALLGLALTSSLVLSAPAYRFSLDGKPDDPLVLPVLGHRKGEPAPGDLVYISRIPLVLRQPGHYQFRIGGKHREVIYCKIDDGPEHCVGVRVEQGDEDEARLIDPLSTMPAADKKHLFGISLEGRPAAWARALSDINWSQTALSANSDIGITEDDAHLPALPRELHYLELDIYRSPGISDLSTLRDLTELRHLNLDISGTPFDVSLIANAKALRHLTLTGWQLENVGALSSLTAMRFLKLRYCEPIDDVVFASSMPELRVLKFDKTDVSDLRPLSGLRHLRLVSAHDTKVRTLPDGAALPALRDLRLLSTPVADDAEALAAFSASAPECVVKTDWAETLRGTITGATRLRVRTGGTCHRDPDFEKTLIDIKDAGLIDALIAAIQIDPGRCGGHCMCCGNPSFEFYKEEKLIATLGFHHGQSLRWPLGWPGDAAVTPESADLLCDFLADHGHTGPKEERERQKAHQRASSRYWEAALAIAPQAYLKSVRALRNDGGVPDDDTQTDGTAPLEKLTTSQWPDVLDRARALFSLYGALPEMSWSHSPGVDSSLRERLLSTVSVSIPVLLAEDHPKDQILQGIARWCFFDREGRESKAALAPRELAVLSAWGLAHPREINRRKTVLALDSPHGEPLLLKFLRKPPEPRPLPGEFKTNPGGTVTYQAESHDLPADASPREIAASVLASRSCEAARPILEDLSGAGTSEDRKYYARALGALNKKTDAQ